MARSNLAAQQPPPPSSPSPERLALAEAITKHDAARRELASIRDAIANSWRASSAARARVDDATAAIEAAKAADADRIQAALMSGGTLPAPSSARDAAAALADAEAALAAVEAARAALPAKRSAAETSLALAEMFLRGRVLAVLRAEAPVASLVQQYMEARARFRALGAAMRFLGSEKLLPADWSWPTDNADDTPPRDEPWRAFAERLARDADAALPE